MPKRVRQADCIVSRSCVIANNLGYNFLKSLQQKVRICVSGSPLFQNSLCITEKSNCILYMSYHSIDRDSEVWKTY